MSARSVDERLEDLLHLRAVIRAALARQAPDTDGFTLLGALTGLISELLVTAVRDGHLTRTEALDWIATHGEALGALVTVCTELAHAATPDIIMNALQPLVLTPAMCAGKSAREVASDLTTLAADKIAALVMHAHTHGWFSEPAPPARRRRHAHVSG